MEHPQTLLTVRGLSKSFPGVQALKDVDFNLHRGEVHAVVGENGAGKSTLMRIIAGICPPDAGSMELAGQPYTPCSRAVAEHRGVRMVMQELNLVANLTIAENLFLGRIPTRLGVIRYRHMNAQAGDLMQRMGMANLDPTVPISRLSVGQQQLVEIAAALASRFQLLILDEPTASLTDSEADLLFRQIAELKAKGVGIVYISHRLEEIRRIADRVTILRDGQRVASQLIKESSIDDIVRLMVGRELDASHYVARPPGTEILRVENLSAGPLVRDVNFTLRQGEILGFAGLLGSGRTETMRALFGADKRQTGRIFLRGQRSPARIRSPRDAVRQGIALLTEDRKGQGLLLPLPVRANITLAHLRKVCQYRTRIRPSAEREISDRYIQGLGVKCHSREQRAGQLSGGNQQKVVIARWLFRNCDIMIFDEPTRGIDVGTKFEIYRMLQDLAAQGKGVILVSSDLKELLSICDRLAVMSLGRIAAILDRSDWSQDKIMAAALSEHLIQTNDRMERAPS